MTGAVLENKKRCDSKDAERFATDLFAAHGISIADSNLAANVLVSADAAGYASHGLARLPVYIEMLESGRLNRSPRIDIKAELGGCVSVDGANGLGLVVGPKALDIAIVRAEEFGCSSVFVGNSNHFGIASYYGLKAAEKGMICISMTNTTACVAPPGCSTRLTGTNPISIVGMGKDFPLISDFSTSTVSYGKLQIAQGSADQERVIPSSWAKDINGGPTTDPWAIENGGTLTTLGENIVGAEHKGYCLAVMVDYLCSVASGGAMLDDVPQFVAIDGHNTSNKGASGEGSGHLFICLNIGALLGPSSKKRAAQFTDKLENYLMEQPSSRVTIPGKIDHDRREQALRGGLQYDEKLLDKLEQMAGVAGVNPLRQLGDI